MTIQLCNISVRGKNERRSRRVDLYISISFNYITYPILCWSSNHFVQEKDTKKLVVWTLKTNM